MAASSLLCRRFMSISAHLLVCGAQQPTTKAGAAPHLYTLIEGTQSPALEIRWPLREELPEEAAQMHSPCCG
jgi:hypothetical protein